MNQLNHWVESDSGWMPKLDEVSGKPRTEMAPLRLYKRCAMTGTYRAVKTSRTMSPSKRTICDSSLSPDPDPKRRQKLHAVDDHHAQDNIQDPDCTGSISDPIEQGDDDHLQDDSEDDHEVVQQVSGTFEHDAGPMNNASTTAMDVFDDISGCVLFAFILVYHLLTSLMSV